MEEDFYETPFTSGRLLKQWLCTMPVDTTIGSDRSYYTCLETQSISAIQLYCDG